MTDPHNRQAFASSAGTPPPTTERGGSSIDSAMIRLERLALRINVVREEVTRLANSIHGPTPENVITAKIDHPPCTLQEHMTYVEERFEGVEQQIARFF